MLDIVIINDDDSRVHGHICLNSVVKYNLTFDLLLTFFYLHYFNVGIDVLYCISMRLNKSMLRVSFNMLTDQPFCVSVVDAIHNF